MAMDTMVNGQITDAVTQANVKVLGDAPAIAMGNLYQATAQALSNAAHNATFAQQQTNMIAQASTTQGINLIYGANTVTEGAVAEKINQSDLPAMIASLKEVLESFKK
jgi:Killing trait